MDLSGFRMLTNGKKSRLHNNFDEWKNRVLFCDRQLLLQIWQTQPCFCGGMEGKNSRHTTIPLLHSNSGKTGKSPVNGLPWGDVSDMIQNRPFFFRLVTTRYLRLSPACPYPATSAAAFHPSARSSGETFRPHPRVRAAPASPARCPCKPAAPRRDPRPAT